MDCEGIWITARDIPTICELTGCHRTTVARWLEKREFDEDTCELIAHSLDLPTTYVLAEIQATRSKNPKHARRWHRLALLAKKAQAVGLVILAVGVGVVGGSESAKAAQGISSNFNSTIYTLYA